jgi:hypothetical protein
LLLVTRTNRADLPVEVLVTMSARADEAPQLAIRAAAQPAAKIRKPLDREKRIDS